MKGIKFIIAGLVLLSVPTTLILISSAQDIRQRASEPVPTPFPVDQVVNPDVNGDGAVDELDIAVINSCIQDSSLPECAEADVDQNGTIDENDLNFVLRSTENTQISE